MGQSNSGCFSLILPRIPAAFNAEMSRRHGFLLQMDSKSRYTENKKDQKGTEDRARLRTEKAVTPKAKEIKEKRRIRRGSELKKQ